MRTEAKPGSEVFDSGPAGHVEANLRDDGLSSENVNAVDGSEIDASHFVEFRTEIKDGLVAAAFAGVLGFRKGMFVEIDLRFEDGKLSKDLVIASLDLMVVELVHLDHLLEREEMFGREIAVERFCDFLFRFGAFTMTELSQNVRVALAIEDGLDDGHAGETGDVGDDRSEFDVHQLKGLLDVLDMRGPHLDEIIAVADVSAKRTDLRGRDEGATQKAVGVELLDPLAVENVRLLAGDILDMASVDDKDFKAASFKDFEGGDPVDTGGLHGNGIDLSSFEPISEGMEISGESGEFADGSVETTLGNSGPNLLITNIETGSIEIDLLESLERNDLAVTAFIMGLLGHDRILLLKLG